MSGKRADPAKSLDLLKGPPVLGRLLSLTLNCTPRPSGLAVAVTSPSMLPPSG